MKWTVDSVTYNTETATRLAQSTWERGGAEVTGVLYQTCGGAFFVHEFWTKKIWIERLSQTEERDYNEFIPLSATEAQAWITEGEVEVIASPFEDPPEVAAESDLGATIFIRVPASLKQRVDKAAEVAKLSGNAWAIKCVERCLDPRNVLGKRNLAKAYDILAKIGGRIDGGLSATQVSVLIGEAMEELEGAWIDLGFNREDTDADIPTQIISTAAADRITKALSPAASNATVDALQNTPLPTRTLDIEVKNSPPKD